MMINKRNVIGFCFLFVLSLIIVLGGCAATVPTPAARVTNRVAPTQALPGAILDQITVEDLRVTCDLMARDLIMQEFVYAKKSTPIMAVKPIENKTDLTIDPDIFQKTIRVKLMEKSGGRILFRDEESYKYTLDERVKQSDGKVQITTTTTRTRTQAPTRVGQPLNVQKQAQTDTRIEDEAEVEKKVADIDYFLTGLIYSSTEVAAQNAPQGMRYFQFQFRVTDASTNIIMWEKEYLVKRQASFR